jgi:hypothetical protein
LFLSIKTRQSPVTLLLQVNKSVVAAVAAVGVLVSLLAAIVLAATNCKQISDTLLQGRAYFKFKDHSDKIGYQNEVRWELQIDACDKF